MSDTTDIQISPIVLYTGRDDAATVQHTQQSGVPQSDEIRHTSVSVFNRAGPGLSGRPKLSKKIIMQKNSQIRLVIARDLWSMQGFPKS